MASSARIGFLVLASGTLVGKVVALGREVVFAGAFGAGTTAAGFRVAQNLSFVPANLVASDVLSAAFAPSYALALKNDSARAAATVRAYAMALFTTLSLTSLAFALVSRPVVDVIVPGASQSVRDAATGFLLILVWTIPLYGVSQVFALTLATHGRFFSQSVRPLLQSIGLLVGTALAVTTGWLPWLSVGFVGAWLVYTLLTFGVCARRGLFRDPSPLRLRLAWRIIGADARRIAPLMVIPVFVQIAIILERTFASLGPPQLLASVDYARTISDSFMSLIAVPFGLLGLTRLSTMAVADFERAVGRVIDVVLIVVAPISMGLLLLAEPLVRLLYFRGSFSTEDVRVTAEVLSGHSALLFAQVLGYSLSRALIASGRSRVVLMVTLPALGAQVATQALVVTPLTSYAVGLGPSIYGLILTIWFVRALDAWRHVRRVIITLAPIFAIAMVGVTVTDSLLARLGCAVLLCVVWALLVVSVPVLRSATVRELVEPVRVRFRHHAQRSK